MRFVKSAAWISLIMRSLGVVLRGFVLVMILSLLVAIDVMRAIWWAACSNRLGVMLRSFECSENSGRNVGGIF